MIFINLIFEWGKRCDYMDFYEVIDKRRTVRDFEDAPIDDTVLERIIGAGLKAPTNDHMRD